MKRHGGTRLRREQGGSQVPVRRAQSDLGPPRDGRCADQGYQVQPIVQFVLDAKAGIRQPVGEKVSPPIVQADPARGPGGQGQCRVLERAETEREMVKQDHRVVTPPPELSDQAEQVPPTAACKALQG